MALIAKADAVVAKVEEYAQAIIGVATVAVTAVDPTVLPHKYAAAVATVNGAIMVAKRALPNVEAKVAVVEADVAKAPSVIEKVKAVIKQDVVKVKADVKKPAVNDPAVLAAAQDLINKTLKSVATTTPGNGPEVPVPAGPGGA